MKAPALSWEQLSQRLLRKLVHPSQPLQTLGEMALAYASGGPVTVAQRLAWLSVDITVLPIARALPGGTWLTNLATLRADQLPKRLLMASAYQGIHLTGRHFPITAKALRLVLRTGLRTRHLSGQLGGMFGWDAVEPRVDQDLPQWHQRDLSRGERLVLSTVLQQGWVSPETWPELFTAFGLQPDHEAAQVIHQDLNRALADLSRAGWLRTEVTPASPERWVCFRPTGEDQARDWLRAVRELCHARAIPWTQTDEQQIVAFGARAVVTKARWLQLAGDPRDTDAQRRLNGLRAAFTKLEAIGMGAHFPAQASEVRYRLHPNLRRTWPNDHLPADLGAGLVAYGISRSPQETQPMSDWDRIALALTTGTKGTSRSALRKALRQSDPDLSPSQLEAVLDRIHASLATLTSMGLIARASSSQEGRIEEACQAALPIHTPWIDRAAGPNQMPSRNTSSPLADSAMCRHLQARLPPGVKLESWLAHHRTAIDRRIGSIIQTHGRFDWPSFVLHLARTAREDRAQQAEPAVGRNSTSADPHLQFKEPSIPKKELAVDQDLSRVYAYLIQTRAIAPEVVQAGVARGIITQAKHRPNVLFLGKDDQGQVRHIEKRGTLSDRPFKGYAAGSDPALAFHWHTPGAETLTLCRSAVEVLSRLSLDLAQGTPSSYQVVPGLEINGVLGYLTPERGTQQIHLAFGNRKADIKRAHQLEQALKSHLKKGVRIATLHPPHGADWNAYLQEARSGSPSELTPDTHAAYRTKLQAKNHTRKKSAGPEHFSVQSVRKAYQRHVNRLVTLAREGHVQLALNHPGMTRYSLWESATLADAARVPELRQGPHPLAAVTLPKGLPQKKGMSLSEAERLFLLHLARFGVADRATFNGFAAWQGHHAALHRTHDQPVRSLPHELALRLDLAENGLNRLVAAGWVQTQSIPNRTPKGLIQQTVYTLSPRGHQLLRALDHDRLPYHGPFAKKQGELTHELLVHRFAIAACHAALIRGEHITKLHTDHDLKSAHERAMARIIHAWRRRNWSTRKEADYQQLAVQVKRGKPTSLSPNQKERWHRLNQQRARLNQADLKTYHRLKRTPIPDLALTIVTPGQDGQEDDVRVERFEIDSGDNGRGGGGYTSREIQRKLAGDPDLNWVTPGGLNRGQGRRIQRHISAMGGRGRVYSI